MKKKLLDVAQHCQLIDLDRSLMIRGGNGGPPLSQAQLEMLFDYSDIGGFNSTLGKQFTAQIDKMESTNFGYGMLSSMLGAHEPIIKLTNTAPANTYIPPTAGAAFLSDSNTFYMPPSFANSSLGDLLITTTHELYHAFETYILQITHLSDDDPNASVKVELDAYLAGAKLAQEYDSQNGTTYYRDNYTPYLSLTSTQNAGQSPGGFLAAWQNLVEQGHFTLANYNTLITYFQVSGFNYDGTGLGGPYAKMNKDTVSDINDINQVQIDRLFNYNPPSFSTSPSSYGVIHNYNDVTNYIQSVLNYYYKRDLNLGHSWSVDPTVSLPTPVWTYDSLYGVFKNQNFDTMGSFQIPPIVMQILVDISQESPMSITQQQFNVLFVAMQQNTLTPNSAVGGILSAPTLAPWIDPNLFAGYQRDSSWSYDIQTNSWRPVDGTYPDYYTPNLNLYTAAQIDPGGTGSVSPGSPSSVSPGGVSWWYSDTDNKSVPVISGNPPPAGYNILQDSSDAGVKSAYQAAWAAFKDMGSFATTVADAAALAYQNAEATGASQSVANDAALQAAKQIVDTFNASQHSGPNPTEPLDDYYDKMVALIQSIWDDKGEGNQDNDNDDVEDDGDPLGISVVEMITYTATGSNGGGDDDDGGGGGGGGGEGSYDSYSYGGGDDGGDDGGGDGSYGGDPVYTVTGAEVTITSRTSDGDEEETTYTENYNQGESGSDEDGSGGTIYIDSPSYSSQLAGGITVGIWQ